jgi:mycothiol synthase
VSRFDGSETALRDWNDVYNQSFAAHDPFIPSTVEQCRDLAAASGFLADGLLLAHRGDRCVGFCRNEQIGRTGVVGMLGVVPGERTIGLGRAMLRWALAYFAGKDVDEVGLLVSGENPSALALYHSEGFEVVRTREIWERPLDVGN